MHLTQKEQVINSCYPEWHLILLAFIFRSEERCISEELWLLMADTAMDALKMAGVKGQGRLCWSQLPYFECSKHPPGQNEARKQHLGWVRPSPVFWVVPSGAGYVFKGPKALPVSVYLLTRLML